MAAGTQAQTPQRTAATAAWSWPESRYSVCNGSYRSSETVAGKQVLSSHPVSVLCQKNDNWNNVRNFSQSAIRALGLEKFDTFLSLLAVQEWGVHWAWRHTVERDLAGGLLGKSLAHQVDTGLGSLVQGVTWGVCCQKRGGEHDHGSLVGDLVGGLSEEQEGRLGVDVEHGVVLVQGGLGKRLSQNHTNVVNGIVDFAELGNSGVENVLCILLRGQITVKHKCLDLVVGLELRSELGDGLLLLSRVLSQPIDRPTFSFRTLNRSNDVVIVDPNVAKICSICTHVSSTLISDLFLSGSGSSFLSSSNKKLFSPSKGGSASNLLKSSSRALISSSFASSNKLADAASSSARLSFSDFGSGLSSFLAAFSSVSFLSTDTLARASIRSRLGTKSFFSSSLIRLASLASLALELRFFIGCGETFLATHSS
ncbi:hypothetical protein OGAPHI_000315 [Ogataea philodendri]|uniref:Uncharacterized protein n=1 Tax=Ogataea philodendri TaxID=1378263 RepID=A0A9P8PGG7_9ASCO|nr:uncharacterized protein OGAPHI_000315 [Ogataea philodendri]KAH3671612.1 hypothetical protein OGAPHI_000315 [Ogataea philodendri]